jgi:hypothetical protein
VSPKNPRKAFTDLGLGHCTIAAIFQNPWTHPDWKSHDPGSLPVLGQTDTFLSSQINGYPAKVVKQH